MANTLKFSFSFMVSLALSLGSIQANNILRTLGLDFLGSDQEVNVGSFESQSGGKMPVGFMGVSHLNPYDVLEVDPSKNAVGCPVGSETVLTIAPRSAGNMFDLDYPLYTCEQTGVGDGLVINSTEKLVFGGIYGTYKDYPASAGPPERYNNPYTGTSSCESFDSFQVYGMGYRDWGLVACFKVIPINEESPYSHLIYKGFVRNEAECPGGAQEAHKIYGSSGSPHPGINDDFDLPLYLCVEDTDTNPNNSVAQVLDLTLLGLSDGTDENPTEITTLQDGARIPYNIAPNLPYFSIRANVSHFGNQVNDDFPQNLYPDGEIPFRIKFSGTRNGEPVRDTFRVKFAPYTIGSHNESGGFIYQWTGANQNAVGFYDVEAIPIEADSDTVIGEGISLSFEIYDPNQTTLDPDITPPTTPTGLSVASKTSSQVCLSWNASTDPAGASNERVSGLAGYDVFVDGQLDRTSTDNNSCVTGLSDETRYEFFVRAKDNAGNFSSGSNQVSTTTNPRGNGDSNLPDDGLLGYYFNKWTDDYGYSLMGSSDSDGFHSINILPGKRVVYVSNAGNDNNSGDSKSEPVKTLDRAHQIASNGDNNVQAVLLRRGDRFTFSGDGNKFRVNGPSATAPFYLADYEDSATGRDLSDPRPIISVPDGESGLSWVGADHKNRAILNLEFVPEVSGEGKGIRMVVAGDSRNILIQNCVLSQFEINLELQGNRLEPIRNLIVSRNILRDSQSNGRHIFDNRNQGIYTQHIKGLLMTENILYNNGRHNHPSYIVNGKMYSSIFSHNGYGQYETRDAIFVNNISALAGSHGYQMRGGGDMVSNLFLRNPIAAFLGHDNTNRFNDGTQRAEPMPGSAMLYNVALDSYDIHPEVCRNCSDRCVRRNSDGQCIEEGPDDVDPQRRAWCFQMKFIRDGRAEQNMCLQQKTGTQASNSAETFTINGVEDWGINMTFKNNLGYKWYAGDGELAVALEGDNEEPVGVVDIWNNFWDGPIRRADASGFNFGTGSNANQSALGLNPNIDYDLEDFISDTNGARNLDEFINRLQDQWSKANWETGDSVEDMITRIRGVYSEFLPTQ